MKFSEKRKTIQHNFSPQNSSRPSLRNLPFLENVCLSDWRTSKSKERNKHCWYVRNNDYLTAEKIREVSQLRLAVVDSSFFSFLFHTNPPTANDGFRLFTRTPSFRARPRERVQDPMLSLSPSSKVLTISNNLTDFKGSSLRRWFGARNYKSAASQLFFQFSIRCLFYSWKVISPALFSRIFELSDH